MRMKESQCDLHERIKESNPQALICDGLDEAIIGVAVRCGQPSLVVYDSEKIVLILMKRDKMTREEAEEYYLYNIEGAWMGENTPLFLHRFEKRV